MCIIYFIKINIDGACINITLYLILFSLWFYWSPEYTTSNKVIQEYTRGNQEVVAFWLNSAFQIEIFAQMLYSFTQNKTDLCNLTSKFIYLYFRTGVLVVEGLSFFLPLSTSVTLYRRDFLLNTHLHCWRFPDTYSRSFSCQFVQSVRDLIPNNFLCHGIAGKSL